MTLTTLPPQLRFFSTLRSVCSVTPSSPIPPRSMKPTSRIDTADVGAGVSSGPANTPPEAVGSTAKTLLLSAMLIAPFVRHRLQPGPGKGCAEKVLGCCAHQHINSQLPDREAI